jgi:hypothetical protein
LSRKELRPPDIQKNCQAWVTPVSAPWAFSKQIAGVIVMNMPMNNKATSTMAEKVK